MVWEYSVSKIEVDRRRKAFLSLSIFLVMGLLAASKTLKMLVPIWIYASYLVVLLVSNLWINNFFDKFLLTKIILSKKTLERKSCGSVEKFLVKNIAKVKIKKTSNDLIREIYIYLKNGNNIFINGLNKFDEFAEKLLTLVRKDINLVKTKEPMDFDSVFFYPVLGLLISWFTVFLLKILYSLDYKTMKIVFVVLIIYILLMTFYLVFSKPISKRYGKYKK